MLSREKGTTMETAMAGTKNKLKNPRSREAQLELEGVQEVEEVEEVEAVVVREAEGVENRSLGCTGWVNCDFESIIAAMDWGGEGGR